MLSACRTLGSTHSQAEQIGASASENDDELSFDPRPSGIGRSCLGIQFLPGGGDLSYNILSRTDTILYLSRRDRLRSPPPDVRSIAGLRRAKITSQHICMPRHPLCNWVSSLRFGNCEG